MPAAESAPAAGPPATPVGSPVPPVGPPVPPVGSAAGPASGDAPKSNVWRRTTSTNAGRWGLAIAAGALALLMLLGIGAFGLALLRHGDRIDLLGNRQDGRSFDQRGPGNGRGPWADDRQDGKKDKDRGNRQGMQGMQGIPGMPGGRGQGLGGLGNLVGGAALHGEVTATLNGSVQALVFQRGEVTAVSATSITLKSSDGFVGTYGRTAATVSRGAAPVTGGQAFVLARAADKVAIMTMAVPAGVGVAPSS